MTEQERASSLEREEIVTLMVAQLRTLERTVSGWRNRRPADVLLELADLRQALGGVYDTLGDLVIELRGEGRAQRDAARARFEACTSRLGCE